MLQAEARMRETGWGENGNAEALCHGKLAAYTTF